MDLNRSYPLSSARRSHSFYRETAGVKLILCAARQRHPSVKRQDRALCAKKTKQLTARDPVSTVCKASLRKSAEPASWPRRAARA